MRQTRRKKYTRILEKRKRSLSQRLDLAKRCPDQPGPVFQASNIHYEVSEKVRAIGCGGIGAIHQMVKKIGLVEEIDRHLVLLKLHAPYHESDHVLNIAYNALLGGMRLEDIELRRNDESFMNGLGAERIPDPTTAGDFTRRLTSAHHIETLMECINRSRARVWDKASFRMPEAFIDIDGTHTPTGGECKEGMDISYNGIWGYHPLLVSLANTKEVLYLENRPGNVPSHTGAARWIGKAIKMVAPYAERVFLRGDTDFSLTAHFDDWSEKADFVFGMDAKKNLVELADQLSAPDWSLLERPAKYEVKTEPRWSPDNVKEQIVRLREYRNIRLTGEEVAEFPYRPGKCEKTYRMVVVRKNLSISRGDRRLFDEVRYFFYITTRWDLPASEVVFLANDRCDQENVISQLKNGVNAMRMPVRDLPSNWAYMVMTSLAWNLKAWYGLLMPNRKEGLQVMKMEFRRFLHGFILLPCQILRTGRRIVYRLLGYNEHLEAFFKTWERIRRLSFA